MFMSIANFSACVRRLDVAGPSANCCGDNVRNRIFIMASRIVGWRAVASFVGFPIYQNNEKTFQDIIFCKEQFGSDCVI